jgi:hypothetical protein
VQHGWKKFKKQETDKTHRGGARDKTQSEFSADLPGSVGDHSDPYHGHLCFFKILSNT